MAEMQRGGIRLTVEEASKFLSDLDKSSQAMESFGAQTQRTTQQVNTSFQGGIVDTQALHTTLLQLSKEGYAAVDARAQDLLRTQGAALTSNQAYAQALQEVSSSLSTADQATLGLVKSSKDAADEAENASLSYIAWGAAISVVSAQATKAVLGVTLMASRIKELSILLEVTRQNAIYVAETQGDMGRAAALSAHAVEGQVQGIRDLHLSGEVANKTVATLIRYNLDWTRSSELAALAQDAATFAAQDSSQAVDGLVKGITTLQPRILRTYGLMINLNEAYRKFSAENNVVVKDMTVLQRQQAALNEVLSQAPSIAGAYEASLGSASKQIRSIKTDVVNLSEAYGSFLEPALAEGVSGFRSLLQVLTELPTPLRALVSGLAAGGTATATLTATTSTGLLALLKMREALSALSGTALTASTALLGIGGAITAILGVTLAVTAFVREQEEATNDLKASILASTDSYDDYVERMNRAGLAADTLAENIWKVVRAKEADMQIDQAKQYIEAQEVMEDMVRSLDAIAAGADPLQVLAEGLGKIAEDDNLAQIFAEDDKYLQQLIESSRTFAGYAAEDATKVIDSWKLVAQALQVGATLQDQQAAVEFIENLKNEMDLTGKEGVQLEIILNAVQGAVEGLGPAFVSTYDDMIQKTEELNEAFGRQLTLQWYRDRTERHREFTDAVIEASEKADEAIVDAATKRDRALDDLDIKYFNKSQDAWRDYQRALAESEQDLADFHAGTLTELLKLDLEYLRDRQDAWTKYQQDLADAERELQRDIEDANRKRVQALQDLDREYAQDLEDARRELNQDLEDIARDHADRMQDIEDDRRERSLDLEEEYQQRLYDINNYGQQRLRELQLDYQERASDARLKYLREALEQIEGGFYAADFEQVLRDLFLGLREFGPGEIPNQFRDLYAKLLEELEGLQDDQKWAEEDLSDDIDREYDQRLQDLEEWLEEEQAAIEEAYQERIAAEQQRFEDERAARQEDYDRKLEDLQRARDREREEIKRDHERRLQDIRIQAERERQEIARGYAQRLEDLSIEYDREKTLVGQKLEEQNAEARKKYEEALEDISVAKQRERDEINRQFDLTKKDALDDLDDMVTDLGIKFGLLPDTLRPTYNIIKADLHKLLQSDPDSLTNQWSNFLNILRTRILESGSPSRVFMKIGESIIGGLEKGMGGETIGDMLTGSFDAQAFQANISAALPANMASMPMSMMGGSSTATTNNNLTVNAQYQHQSEASLRDDLSLYNSMLRAYGR